jgi:hypothetical protein
MNEMLTKAPPEQRQQRRIGICSNNDNDDIIIVAAACRMAPELLPVIETYTISIFSRPINDILLNGIFYSMGSI